MNFINRLLRHELISGSFYIFLGSFISNILAFFLNLFFARSLSYADYAIFASLLSVITLAAIPSNSLNTIIVKYATDLFTKEKFNELKSLYVLFFKIITVLSIFIVLLFSVFSVPFKNYLRLDDLWYMVVCGVIIATFYFNMLNSAFLQSLLKFKYLSFAVSAGGLIKITTGILFIFLGFKAFSGLYSLIFMAIGTFLICFIPLRKILQLKPSKDFRLGGEGILKFAAPAFITVLFLTSFTSTDVILVKHFFNPELAGFYSGLSLIGRVIFYFTAPIPVVMFPLLVKRHATGKNFINVFLLSLGLVLLPSIVITGIYFLLPEFVIKLFLGGREYYFIAPYLGLFGAYLTIFSMLNVCVNFFLSLGKTLVIVPVVLAASLQIILIYILHADFYQVIGVSMTISFTLLLILFAAFLRAYGHKVKLKESVSALNSPQV